MAVLRDLVDLNSCKDGCVDQAAHKTIDSSSAAVTMRISNDSRPEDFHPAALTIPFSKNLGSFTRLTQDFRTL